jgi:F420-0:gamma-glutamyl ligase-like protein
VRDSDLRAALLRRLDRRHSHDAKTLILQELGLRHGAARVDIAVVNGSLHGYELKSDSDSLVRLARQALVYGSVLDRVTLVVGRRHAEEAVGMVPAWWGVEVARVGPRGGLLFSCVRRAKNNPSQDPVAVAKLLWREEALELLQQLGAAEGFGSKPRAAIYARLAEVADPDEIRSRVRDRLRNRTGWRSGGP